MTILLKIHCINSFNLYGEIIFCKIIEKNFLNDFYYINNDDGDGDFYFENKKINVKIDLETQNKTNYLFHYKQFIIFKKKINDGIKLEKGDVINYIQNNIGR